MRNIFLLFTLVLPLVLGCGLADRIEKAVSESGNSNITVTNSNTAKPGDSNKSLTDQAVETAVGESEIGIPECDEAIRMLANQMDNPDDNFVVKAGKQMVENAFREQLKQQLAEKNADKVAVAKFCKEFKDSLEDGSVNVNTNSSTEWK